MTGAPPRLLLLLIFTAGALCGQPFSSGSIAGVVVDEGQQPLSDVEVRLVQSTTGRPWLTTTDVAGAFRFADLPSGQYALTLSRQGYATRRTVPFEVLLGTETPIRIELQRLAPASTRARAGLEGIALEYGLVREQIEAVPTLLGSEGRTSIDKLLLYVPGMSPVDALEIDPFSGQAAAVSANGSRRSAINYQLDGASNNAQNRITGAQAATFGPVPEALETFRVTTHTYSARDGRNAGAVVGAVTRSGGASWHGGARGFFRPRSGDELASFDDSVNELSAWATGGQLGGPLSLKRGLFAFLDLEGWRSEQRRTESTAVIPADQRNGDFSALPAGEQPVDPATGEAFANGQLPATAIDSLSQRYLDTFLPIPNGEQGLFRGQTDLDSTGQVMLARLDWRRTNWSLSGSYHLFRNTLRQPFAGVTNVAPGTAARRRQFAHNAQLTLTYSPIDRFTTQTQFAGTRLSIDSRQGIPGFEDFPADEFGFNYREFVDPPGTLPDVTLVDASIGTLQIAPFVASESSAQTTLQLAEHASLRLGRVTLLGGGLLRRGIWPFTNTENFAGSFVFGREAFQGARNATANLLMGIPSEYAFETPRSLDLRWRELAAYGQAEARLAPGLQLTAGVRFEAQPPAVDRFDRIAAFRNEVESQRFEDTLPNLIFPGDPDPGFGALPRSTVRTRGRQVAPRIGVTFSPSWDSTCARWLFGDANRSVFRASYGLFHDFGTFAGSSAAALFQASYPPFATDSRFDFSRLATRGSFQAPFSTVSVPDGPSIRNSFVTRPILVFDPEFDNAKADHWTFGWQRLIPGRVLLSGIFVGTRSQRLLRQRELNIFVRNPILNFSQVQNQRLFERYRDVRQFESSGTGRYHGWQLRATRYLLGRLAFDGSYTWGRSFDDGSSQAGDALITEAWTRSDFDRRHTVTASWYADLALPGSWTEKTPWLETWRVSGTWRWRSGLPLDIRQTQDPTFSFQEIGRPDASGGFVRLDPGQIREFTLADGSTVRGRFAFDPTAFQEVVPTSFAEVRPGTSARNAYTAQGFQRWDMRIAKPIALAEERSIDVGIDLINVFNNKNWDMPFTNVDQPLFGIVRGEGVGRTLQINMRVRF